MKITLNSKTDKLHEISNNADCIFKLNDKDMNSILYKRYITKEMRIVKFELENDISFNHYKRLNLIINWSIDSIDGRGKYVLATFSITKRHIEFINHSTKEFSKLTTIGESMNVIGIRIEDENGNLVDLNGKDYVIILEIREVKK